MKTTRNCIDSGRCESIDFGVIIITKKKKHLKFQSKTRSMSFESEPNKHTFHAECKLQQTS